MNATTDEPTEEGRGGCGCAACALRWLVHQDEQALWNEHGELVVDPGPECQRVSDPRQLRLPFST